MSHNIEIKKLKKYLREIFRLRTQQLCADVEDYYNNARYLLLNSAPLNFMYTF